MGNALAVILGAVEREKAVPFLFTGSRNGTGASARNWQRLGK